GSWASFGSDRPHPATRTSPPEQVDISTKRLGAMTTDRHGANEWGGSELLPLRLLLARCGGLGPLPGCPLTLLGRVDLLRLLQGGRGAAVRLREPPRAGRLLLGRVLADAAVE